MPDNNITFHVVLSDPETRSPLVKYTYITYIYLVTKEQKLSYKYIKHSKHQKRIMSIIIHSCALSFTVFILKMSRGETLFSVESSRKRSGKASGVAAPSAIGSTAPLQCETPPWRKFSPDRCVSVHSVTDCYGARWSCRADCTQDVVFVVKHWFIGSGALSQCGAHARSDVSLFLSVTLDLVL